MNCVTCFALCCVLLLSKVDANDFFDTSQTGDGVRMEAKIALEDLENIINAIVNIAIESIVVAKRSISILEEVVLKFAQAEINQLGDEIMAKLDEIKKDADDIFVDVIDCTENREEDIKQLLVTFLNETGDCAVDRLDQVFDSFADIIVDIEYANDLLVNFTQQMEQCQNELDPDACIAKLLEDMTDAALQIPPRVMEDINQSKKLVNELENYLFECYHDNYNILEITTQEIYNGIVECIKDKLPNP